MAKEQAETEKNTSSEISANIAQMEGSKSQKLSVGCKIFVRKDKSLQKAEVLSLQTKKNQPYFYVHYQGFNKVFEAQRGGRSDCNDMYSV